MIVYFLLQLAVTCILYDAKIVKNPKTYSFSSKKEEFFELS